MQTLRRSFLYVIVFSLFWWLLTGGVAYSWWFGVPVIFMASAIAVKLGNSRHSLHFSAIPEFLWHFASRSILAGFDVAYRTLHPKLPLNPGLIEYKMQLPAGRPQTFFAGVISLLPGTLSASLHANTITLHVLDTSENLKESLLQTETVIARLFGPGLESHSCSPEGTGLECEAGKEKEAK